MECLTPVETPKEKAQKKPWPQPRLICHGKEMMPFVKGHFSTVKPELQMVDPHTVKPALSICI